MTKVFQPIKLHYDLTLLADLSMELTIIILTNHSKWQTLLPIKLLSLYTKIFLNQIELTISRQLTWSSKGL